MESIILFYKYIPIIDPHGVQQWQQKICTDFNLKGRVILAKEGINATLGGPTFFIKRYIQLMNNHPLFKDIDFKESEGSTNHFPRLSIKVRKEIVTLGKEWNDFEKYRTVHKTPQETHNLMENKPSDLLVFDARNQSEWAVGKFKDALTAPINHFRELPDFIENNIEKFRNKRVLMYCTGGIRCEKASAYLNKKGVAKEVMQLEGGIARYAEQYPDGFFRGKNYVFDGRVTVRINEDVLGVCFICGSSADDYVNCPNVLCNRHFICCISCAKKHQSFCSQKCESIQKDIQK